MRCGDKPDQLDRGRWDIRNRWGELDIFGSLIHNIIHE